jgi:IstB-like ATP binding protein
LRRRQLDWQRRQSAVDRRTRGREDASRVSYRPVRVLFARTSDLVQRLQVARRELALEAAITRLDRFHLLILDDLAYVSKDQAETSVLFELISARYEHRSMLITANQPFGAWGKVFPDPAMTLAAVDRLVHHATIFEINVDSYRRRAALERKQKGVGRPQKHATIKDLDPLSRNSGGSVLEVKPTTKGFGSILVNQAIIDQFHGELSYDGSRKACPLAYRSRPVIF